VEKVSIKHKIEITRNILHNAMIMNTTKEILLKISQQLDKYIAEYYYKNREQKDGIDEEECV
jgi:hypothetical protein